MQIYDYSSMLVSDRLNINKSSLSMETLENETKQFTRVITPCTHGKYHYAIYEKYLNVNTRKITSYDEVKHSVKNQR